MTTETQANTKNPAFHTSPTDAEDCRLAGGFADGGGRHTERRLTIVPSPLGASGRVGAAIGAVSDDAPAGDGGARHETLHEGRAARRSASRRLRADARATRSESGDLLDREAGMATAEYAIATLAAVGFAALLVAVLSSGQIKGLLTSLITSALNFG